MSHHLTLPILRRLLADAPWAQDRLRPFAGHRVLWDLAGVKGSFCLDADGLPQADLPAAGTDGTDAARLRRQQVSLHLDAADLGALADGFDGVMRKVAIEGNAGLAAELGFIARHLRPDPEEWLAPWLGDVLAERTGQTLRSGFAWGRQAAGRAGNAGREYLWHEARLLPIPSLVAAQCHAIDTMREDTDRLAQRVTRLERLLAGRRPATVPER